MAITREELKKLVLQEMKQNQVDEGVADWLKQKAGAALTGVGKAATAAGEKIGGANKGKLTPQQKMERVADFIQMAQRDKELSSLILNTKVGQAISPGPVPVKEALGQDFLKAMSAKGIKEPDIDAFIAEMSKNAKAKKMLADLGLETGQQTTTTQQAPTAQQAAPTSAQPDVKPTSSQPADKQQARKDQAAATAQSKNKIPAQPRDNIPVPDKKNLQSLINKVRNPSSDLKGKILVKQPIMARLTAAGFTPQQANFVNVQFNKFLRAKIDKTKDGKQVKILEQEQMDLFSPQHKNLRVFDTNNRAVMGQLISLMKKAISDPKLGKATRQIDDKIINNLAKELSKDVANQARISAGMQIDPKPGAKQAQQAQATPAQTGEKPAEKSVEKTPEKTSGSSTATTSNVPELDADDMEQDQPIVNAPTSPQTKSEPEQPEQKNDSNIPQPAEETEEEVGSEQPAGEKSKEEPEQKPSQEIPANLQNLFKSGLSKEEANNAAVELGRRLKNPQRGKEIVDKFNKWVLQQGLVKENTNSIIRNYILNLLLERKSILLEAFLSDKIREFADKNGLSAAERKALIGAITDKVINVKNKKEKVKTIKQTQQQVQAEPEKTVAAPESAPEQSQAEPEAEPEQASSPENSEEEKVSDKKEEKQITNNVAKSFLDITNKLSSLAGVDPDANKKIAIAMQGFLEDGKGTYITGTDDEVTVDNPKDLADTAVRSGLDLLATKMTSEQATAEQKIELFKSLNQIKELFADNNMKIFVPEYGKPKDSNTMRVLGKIGKGDSVVGVRMLGVNKEPAQVILGTPDPEVMKALGGSVQESYKNNLKQTLVEEIYNLLTGKIK